MTRYDVVIAGGGTAGAAAAWACARRGLKTLLLEKKPLSGAGARWVNGVAEWVFSTVGLPRPEAPELLGEGMDAEIIAGWGPSSVIVTDTGMLELDMRELVARLQRLAVEAGAELRGGVRVVGLEGSEGVRTTEGDDIRARWVVDASGLGGSGLMDPAPPRVAPEHLCAAAQEVREVADRAGAEAFFAARGAPLGRRVMTFTGIAGGYSIVNVRSNGEEVSLLTGSIPADGHPSGRKLLDDFVKAHPWIGPRIFGGASPIPVRRPYDRIALGRVALLGDAACQVFPAHGSGIGAGIIAADVLGEALARGRGVEGYQREWMRRWGGLMAAYDLFRRFSQAMRPGDLEALIETGLMDADSARFGLTQALPALPPEVLLRKFAAAVSVPRLAARAVMVGAKMAAANALYARYPEERGLKTWSRLVATLFGDRPDVA